MVAHGMASLAVRALEPKKKALDPKEGSPNSFMKISDDYSPHALAIKESKWRQLECKTTTLTYSSFWVRCVYVVLFCVFVPLGILTYNISNAVKYQEFSSYSDLPECSLEGFDKDSTWGKECTVQYTLEEDFGGDGDNIYFYYKLTNVYQNHRSYVKSRTEDQLQGDSSGDVSDCSPLERYNGTRLLPCGLIAYSFFNGGYFSLSLSVR